jgi:hypothetical protein
MDQLGPIIGVAAICCLLGAGIGSSKGQGGAGAVLGLLLGPLGILFCLFMKPTVAYEAQRAEALEAERARIRAQQAPAPNPELPQQAEANPWDGGPIRRR